MVGRGLLRYHQRYRHVVKVVSVPVVEKGLARADALGGGGGQWAQKGKSFVVRQKALLSFAW